VTVHGAPSGLEQCESTLSTSLLCHSDLGRLKLGRPRRSGGPRYESGEARKFIAYCLLSCLLLADFAAAQNRSLGYSTYVAMPGQISIFSSALLAVDNTGSACTLDLHSGVLVKFDPDGALIYAKSTTALHGNAFPGPFAAVAADSGGNCYVAGLGTITPTPGVFQSATKSEQFVMKFPEFVLLAGAP